MLSTSRILPRQNGSLILEAMIAMLVFSLGILGIIGLQAATIKASSEAKYRSEASLLANELIGRMWVSDRTQATLQANFASDTNGTAYQAWAWVGTGAGDAGTQDSPTPGTVLAVLPGASANLPTVSVVAVAAAIGASTSLVTVTVSWLSPGDTTPHNYTTVVQIGG